MMAQDFVYMYVFNFVNHVGFWLETHFSFKLKKIIYSPM